MSSIKEDSSLQSKTLLFIDSSSSLSVTDVLGKTFIPLTDFKSRKRIPTGMVTFSYFLKIFLSNHSEKEADAYLYPGSLFEQIDVYKIGQRPVKIDQADSIAGYRKLTLVPGEQCYVIVHMKPLKNEFNAIIPLLINADFVTNYKLFILGHKSELQIFGLVLSGVLLMMILFMLTNYIISRKPEFFSRQTASVMTWKFTRTVRANICGRNFISCGSRSRKATARRTIVWRISSRRKVRRITSVALRSRADTA